MSIHIHTLARSFERLIINDDRIRAVAIDRYTISGSNNVKLYTSVLMSSCVEDLHVRKLLLESTPGRTLTGECKHRCHSYCIAVSTSRRCLPGRGSNLMALLAAQTEFRFPICRGRDAVAATQRPFASVIVRHGCNQTPLPRKAPVQHRLLSDATYRQCSPNLESVELPRMSTTAVFFFSPVV